MEMRQLGRSGLKVSVFSIGAMTFGEASGVMKGLTSTDDEARRVFDASIAAGMNLVDTANIYSEGRSEELTGQWLKGKRPRVLLASKCRFPIGQDRSDPNAMGTSRHHIVQACEDSLRRLGTDWIDLYQIHMQDSSTPIEETMRALDDLIAAGKIRYAGCSNYTGYRLTESLWASDRRNLARFESVQLQWSLVVRDAEREVIPACRAFGLGVLVWSPLASGFLSGKYRRDEAVPEGRLAGWQDTWKRLATDRNWATLDRIRAIAAERGTTPAAVSLAWLLAKPENSSIIVGARTMAQLEANLVALETKLSAAEVQMLDEASAPEWGYPYSFIGRVGRW